MSAPSSPRSFNDRAAQMLERIEYRRVFSPADRQAIFRLRYEGYVADGGIEPDGTGEFTDRWDDVPGTDLIGVYLDGDLVATVRIHASDGRTGAIPATEAFGDVLQPYFDRGLKLVDATRFVTGRRDSAFSAELPYITLRAVAMAAEHYDAYGTLATVRKEHAVVYRRVTGHRAISEPRSYPLLRKPIVCMLGETAILERLTYTKHPFLRSTPAERERIFGSAEHVTVPDRRSPRPFAVAC